ncbi:phosphotransferase family protein [Pararhodobacter sp.]|uniref:phosphotransferase family protein n=1 Tax=Pararhodobacter sp. TaxID=2127056 RepID=UPI002AFE29FB|nr:phosphotransferase family protein [Pararhodobacter sp.]
MTASDLPPVDPTLLRDPAAAVPFDHAALSTFLASKGHRLRAGPVRQFAGGYGNLNYLIKVDETWAVLRRPPLGEIPKGANDMAREYRSLSVLAPVWPLAPRPLAFCEDVSVLGAPFLISEFREGLPLHGTQPLGTAMTAAQARDLSLLQIEILTQLHGFDIAAIGAQGLGRAEGFAARTLRGWSARLHGSGSVPPPEALSLFKRLTEAPPADQRVSVIHNDFKLDNVVVDPVTLVPTAVLDWDMSTLGAPMFDLSTMLTYWCEPADPAGLRATNLTHSDAQGALTRRELAEAYVRASGFDSAQDEADLRVFLALAFAKLGVVYLQLYDRFLTEPEGYARNRKFGAAAPGAFALGNDVLDGNVI